MKLAVIIFAAALWLSALSPLQAEMAHGEAAAPGGSTAVSVQEAVEMHFQTARKLYLAGDRDTALSELNQALRLDPYHSGSAGLYRTIHDEELSLRQVRLPSSDASLPVVPAASPSVAPAGSGEANRGFWRGILNFEGRTQRRLDSLEKTSLQVSGDMGLLKSEVAGQKDLLGAVNQDLKNVAVRQDHLMLGLIALLLALVVLLIMTIRMLMGMRGDLSTVESRLHEHPGAKRRT